MPCLKCKAAIAAFVVKNARNFRNQAVLDLLRHALGCGLETLDESDVGWFVQKSGINSPGEGEWQFIYPVFYQVFFFESYRWYRWLFGNSEPSTVDSWINFDLWSLLIMQDNRTNMAVFLRPDKIMNTVGTLGQSDEC